ncbi:hypothetical protein G7046_g1757 [Stylonectria norvegica]|nr:hypothetical protein G7046_g1757 [Stylonectria norvegica]
MSAEHCVAHRLGRPGGFQEFSRSRSTDSPNRFQHFPSSFVLAARTWIDPGETIMLAETARAKKIALEHEDATDLEGGGDVSAYFPMATCHPSVPDFVWVPHFLTSKTSTLGVDKGIVRSEADDMTMYHTCLTSLNSSDEGYPGQERQLCLWKTRAEKHFAVAHFDNDTLRRFIQRLTYGAFSIRELVKPRRSPASSQEVGARLKRQGLVQVQDMEQVSMQAAREALTRAICWCSVLKRIVVVTSLSTSSQQDGCKLTLVPTPSQGQVVHRRPTSPERSSLLQWGWPCPLPLLPIKSLHRRPPAAAGSLVSSLSAPLLYACSLQPPGGETYSQRWLGVFDVLSLPSKAALCRRRMSIAVVWVFSSTWNPTALDKSPAALISSQPVHPRRLTCRTSLLNIWYIATSSSPPSFPFPSFPSSNLLVFFHPNSFGSYSVLVYPHTPLASSSFVNDHLFSGCKPSHIVLTVVVLNSSPALRLLFSSQTTDAR